MDSLEEDDAQMRKDGEVLDQSAAAEDIDLLLGHDQHIASEESATDLTDGLLSGEHVHEEQPLEQEGDGPFDNGDLCVSEGVGEMSPVEPLSPTINPLSPGLHDPSESEIHQDISQLTYTEEGLDMLQNAKLHSGAMPIPLTFLNLLHQNSSIHMIPTGEGEIMQLSLTTLQSSDQQEDDESKQDERDCNDGVLRYVEQSGEINWLLSEPSVAGGLPRIICVEGSTDQGTFNHSSMSGEMNHSHQSVHPLLTTGQVPSSEIKIDGQKAFRCDFKDCDRLYSTQHHLKVHQRMHTGERPFHCPIEQCNKTFSTNYGLTSHIRVHTGEKPYKCKAENCEKAFKTSGDLQKHMRIHTGEKPFRCPYEDCGRSFTTSNICKVHLRTHTGERPYVCVYPNCGKTFSSATNHRNHIRIHSGEKPYVCEVEGCGKRFTEYSSLYKHNVVHTQAKPYACEHCGKNYRQTSTLAMHKRTAHGEKIDATTPVMFGIQFSDEDGDWSGVKKSHQILNSSRMLTVIPDGETSQNQEDEVGSLIDDGENRVMSPAATVTIGNASGNQHVYFVTDKTQLALLQMLIQQQQQQGDSKGNIDSVGDVHNLHMLKVESLQEILHTVDGASEMLNTLSDDLGDPTSPDQEL